MARDYLGNPVTVRRETTLLAVNDFIEGYLAYETRAERILGAADADPESCLANAYAGLLWMLLEAPEGSGHRFDGSEERVGDPVLRQKWELPEVVPLVIEHRLHRLL